MTDFYRETTGHKVDKKEDGKMAESLLLKIILSELRPQLPIQNPIPFFVHNNPLQYWEKFKFEEGISKSCLLYERAGIQLDRSFIRDFEDLVIPILSGYLDQGLRRWNPPFEDGLWHWFCEFVKYSSQHKSEVFRRLKQNSNQWLFKNPEEILSEILRTRFPDPKDWMFYLKSLLFHFKGWSGMVHILETKPELFPLQPKKISLIEWLTILIVIETKMNTSVWYLDPQKRSCRQNEITAELDRIKNKEQAFYGSVLTQLKNRLHQLQKRRSRIESGEFTQEPDARQLTPPNAQIFFCIDDREESLRRVLEGINSKIETFGTVGFFGVDVSIKPVDQLIFQPFCPPVIQPRKKAIEKIRKDAAESLSSSKKWITALNHTRFTLFEPLIAIFAPLLYFFSLLVRSSNPGLYQNLKKNILTPSSKENGFEYEFDPEFAYSVSEKAKIVGDILKSAGLKDSFSSLVVMMAHGASTTNNPFQKSYGCGACSGQSGFPNAKLFCSFANDKDVRTALKQNGYCIPDETLFLPAHHDTCSDEVHISEYRNMSDIQIAALKDLRVDLEKALKQNTEIRFKRFGVPLSDSPTHRALDWSQPRPEYGHSNVALAVFGPRSLTEGLDLDRRSFLVSYDPTTDVDGSELEYVVMNALPVCANINLDYFTSRAFPDAFGSGSKLPMNIVSGIGLMSGSKSDLKIGLARQMVDQHEALRLLSFVFCERGHLQNVISKSARLSNLIQNEWIHLVRIDPVDFSLEPVTKEISDALR